MRACSTANLCVLPRPECELKFELFLVFLFQLSLLTWLLSMIAITSWTMDCEKDSLDESEIELAHKAIVVNRVRKS